MTDMMEVTITKRLILILAVLLCVCLTAWAEEAGQETDPGIVAGEDAAPASDESTPPVSEAGEEIPSPSAQEEFSLLLHTQHLKNPLFGQCEHPFFFMHLQ